MYSLCQKSMETLRFVERYLLVSIFFSMVVLFAFSVVARELPGNLASTFAWIEEAVRLLNLFLVFIGIGAALERGRHVSISTLRDYLPGRMGLWMRRLIDSVGLVFSIQMTVLSVKLTDFVLGTGQLSPTLNLPMAWVYMAPVAGFSLLALRYLLSLLAIIDRFNPQTRQETEEEAVASPMAEAKQCPPRQIGGVQ